MSNSNKKRTNRQESLTRLGLVIAILVLLNVVAYFFYGYYDLTDDKRYSLTDSTEELIENLDDRVFITVYLEGEFPAGFRRLQNGVQDILRKFRTLSTKVDYQFVNPYDGPTEDVNKMVEQLKKMGLAPTRLAVKGNAETSESYIYPSAVVRYKGRNMPINLLENKTGLDPEIALNNSIRQLEYKFANAFENLRSVARDYIFFLEGHGELQPLETDEMQKELSQHYYTARFNLDSIIEINPSISLVIVAKPTRSFSEKDKFKLDQYIMKGGKVMWLVDRVAASLDSLRGKTMHVPTEFDLNLDDMFFKYGFRINPNMVLDLEASPIALPTGGDPQNPQFELFDWWYHPVADPTRAGHMITKNLDRVELSFANSIDTIATKGIALKKTPLLKTSTQSREQRIPVRVGFEILKYKPDVAKFNKSFDVGLLVEGKFESLYKNRVPQGMMDTLAKIGHEFKADGEYNKMLVIADGDIMRNPIRRTQGGFSAMPLGYNEFAKYTFANKEFLFNCVEYLLGKDNLIEARSKELKLRMLNKSKGEAERGKWQLINIGLPLLLLGIFGGIFNYIRKKRFGS